MTEPNRPADENPAAGSYPPPADPFQAEPAGGLTPNQTPGQPAYPATPPGGQAAYPAAPQYGQPAAGQPQYGQPTSGQPQYGQPQYGQPAAGQPQYGQPAQGQPQYGQPQYPPGAAQIPSQQPYGTPPTSGGPTSGSGYPATGGYPAPGGYPAGGQPYQTTGYPATGQFPGAPEAPKKKSKALMITLIVLSVLLVLCLGGGVGAFFLLRSADQGGQGAADPQAAATSFLEAFYKEQSVEQAEKAVCVQARDKKAITAQVDAIKKLSETYSKPSFTWEQPDVGDQSEKSAKVTVKLTMTTSDEKVSKQELVLTTINDQGWWVCDVQSK